MLKYGERSKSESSTCISGSIDGWDVSEEAP